MEDEVERQRLNEELQEKTKRLQQINHSLSKKALLLQKNLLNA